jgi:membrane protease YdiL (CAAX protease family)
MVGSRVGQTHGRMQPMSSILGRAFSRLLESTPNYVEVTAVLAVALIGRILLLPHLWKGGSQACAAAALLVSVFLYACVDKGNLFTYLGWVRLRHRLWWLYALTGGLLGALVVIWIVRVAGLSLGTDAPGKLLYGVTVGPIVEEVVFRGAAFSVIYVTASSISGLAQWRIALSVTVSSLLFAFAHTTIIGIPWLVFFGMGTLYALLRWRSNSTATAALMHATYNAVIALAMLQASFDLTEFPTCFTHSSLTFNHRASAVVENNPTVGSVLKLIRQSQR